MQTHFQILVEYKANACRREMSIVVRSRDDILRIKSIAGVRVISEKPLSVLSAAEVRSMIARDWSFNMVNGEA